MEKGLFVIPDLHGNYALLEKMLKQWDSTTHHLVQLGDMVDRGPESLAVIRLLQSLNEQGLATILRGNHEDSFLDFLESPVEEYPFYQDIGGSSTISSFIGEHAACTKHAITIAEEINQTYQEEISFLKNLPLYYEWEDWVFVHAGVEFGFADWKTTDPKYMNFMNYQKFIYPKNEHPLKFAVGHTITRKVNDDKSDHVWISPCKSKFMLDGNAAGGGQLNALIIDKKDTYRTIYVK